MRRFAEQQMGWVADHGGFAINAAVGERMGFIKKTYAHLTVQIAAVGALTYAFMQNDALIEKFTGILFRGGMRGMLIYFACFFGVSLLTRKMMEGGKPLSIQYLAAAIWVGFLSVLISPLCWYAASQFGMGIIAEAFILTLCVFGGLTVYALTTKKDFSYLGGGIAIATWSLIGVSFLLMFMGGSGGIWYSILWVVLLGAWILYDTSKILHHRSTDQYVAASVDLLLDFVYMFVHLLMILMNSRR